ncbi:MAG: hypothetical protein AB7S26_26635 [Sandaracinaceae bacterium]
MRRISAMVLVTALAVAGCDDGSTSDAGGGDAGMMADAGMRDGGPPAASCSDGMRNQDESDVDCGGVCGATCTPTEMCGDNGDCTTNICMGGTCQPMASCTDGTMNGSETDVDCGGAMCNPCDDGEACAANADCMSGFCNAMVCAATVCGDGTVQGDEDCDDGSGGTPMETATCDDDCTTAMCGDGAVNTTAGEACDGDGAGTGGETATCDTDCTAAMCGDGVVNAAASETCDDSGESATCDDDCTAAMCGDGVHNMTAGEECDDGNTVDTDACSNTCTSNGPVINVTASTTFDTDTGMLGTAVAMGWNATNHALEVNTFAIAPGAVLTVTGSQPFVVSGNTINIEGTLDASGQDGVDGPVCSTAGPGGAGGAAGPGGFAGGAGGGGGSPAAMLSGVPGGGPGGGQPGLLDSAGGGGAGHLRRGLDGDYDTVQANRGIGGNTYDATVARIGGSGGGGGSSDDDGGIDDDGGAGGGGGGGMVELMSTAALTITGTIDVSGGDGGTNFNCSGNSGSGGGGSGGLLWLHPGAGSSFGSATFAVSGGAGGTDSFAGGDGSDGVVLIDGGCSDGMVSGYESDVDCGGSCSARCADGSACNSTADCTGASSCLAGTCSPATCANGVLDTGETAIDCGGPVCPACSCTDGLRNQDETDIDCGGATCSPCDDGQMCAIDSDCTDACDGGVCVSCFDGAQNQDETDVDCGGATCGPCATGEMCLVGSDCVGLTCDMGVCAICGDGVVNTGEACDTMGPSSTCDADCTLVSCGDGATNFPAGEQCDDGAIVPGDGCNATCQLEARPIAASGMSVTLAGSIDAGDARWTRPSASCGAGFGTNFALDVYAITNTTGAMQTLTITATWMGDGYLHIYRVPLDITTLTSCVTGNDDFGTVLASQITGQVIMPGETLYVMASTYSEGALIGPYTIDVATN